MRKLQDIKSSPNDIFEMMSSNNRYEHANVDHSKLEIVLKPIKQHHFILSRDTLQDIWKKLGLIVVWNKFKVNLISVQTVNMMKINLGEGM